MKENNIEFAEEMCPYLERCSQQVNPRILDLRCGKLYDDCTIYQRFKILSKAKVPTGMERFIMKYGEDYSKNLGIGARV